MNYIELTKAEIQPKLEIALDAIKRIRARKLLGEAQRVLDGINRDAITVLGFTVRPELSYTVEDLIAGNVNEDHVSLNDMLDLQCAQMYCKDILTELENLEFSLRYASDNQIGYISTETWAQILSIVDALDED
jgi:hypothetical protein